MISIFELAWRSGLATPVYVAKQRTRWTQYVTCYELVVMTIDGLSYCRQGHCIGIRSLKYSTGSDSASYRRITTFHAALFMAPISIRHTQYTYYAVRCLLSCWRRSMLVFVQFGGFLVANIFPELFICYFQCLRVTENQLDGRNLFSKNRLASSDHLLQQYLKFNGKL